MAGSILANPSMDFAGVMRDSGPSCNRRHQICEASAQDAPTEEARFACNTNHVISKHLVAQAQDTGRGIALEQLQGIRERLTVRKAQRRVQHSWSFGQLRQFIAYKAHLVGCPCGSWIPTTRARRAPGAARWTERTVPLGIGFSVCPAASLDPQTPSLRMARRRRLSRSRYATGSARNASVRSRSRRSIDFARPAGCCASTSWPGRASCCRHRE